MTPNKKAANGPVYPRYGGQGTYTPKQPDGSQRPLKRKIKGFWWRYASVGLFFASPWLFYGLMKLAESTIAFWPCLLAGPFALTFIAVYLYNKGVK